MLVEGKDDAYVIAELCRIYELPDRDFCIQDCKSNSKLLSKINELLRNSTKPKIVGIVLDADENITSRWQQITDKLKRIVPNYKIPNNLAPKGIIIDPINSNVLKMLKKKTSLLLRMFIKAKQLFILI